MIKVQILDENKKHQKKEEWKIEKRVDESRKICETNFREQSYHIRPSDN